MQNKNSLMSLKQIEVFQGLRDQSWKPFYKVTETNAK